MSEDPASPAEAQRWEDHADWWQREFTDGVDPEYTEQILPLAEEWLEGCGACSRWAPARDRSPAGPRPPAPVRGRRRPAAAQISVARRRGGGPVYARAGAAALPFRRGSFDAAVACLVFEHIDDVDEAIAEVARVLRPGG